jgi:hypothetical protein
LKALTNYKELPADAPIRKVEVADEGLLDIKGAGEVRIETTVNGRKNIIVLQNVLYVPKLGPNLICFTKLVKKYRIEDHTDRTKKEVEVVFKIINQETGFAAGILVEHGNQLRLVGKTIFPGDAQSSESKAAFIVAAKEGQQAGNAEKEEEKASEDKSVKPAVSESKVKLWHERYGHLGLASLAKLAREEMVTGLPVTAQEFETARKQEKVCEPCVMAKHTRRPFTSSDSISKEPLELTHMDVMGPFKVPTHLGARYVATFLDDYSKLSTVQL